MTRSCVFRAWTTECVKNRTGIEERYGDDCMRELETSPALGGREGDRAPDGAVAQPDC